MRGAAFETWLESLETRHAAGLSFRELRTGVVALSRIYVEGRERLEQGAVFRGRAKRAAFACFYTPLHYLVVDRIVGALGLAEPGPRRILDLGCGLGAAGAAFALAAGGEAPLARARVDGIDRNPWAVSEARQNLSDLGVRGRVRQASLGSKPLDARYDAVIAAFTVNELSDSLRGPLLENLLSRRGTVLIVEPIAKRATPWWNGWASAFESRGGRGDTWRFPVVLPPPLEKLDRASGLNHRELTARSLCLTNFP